MMLRTFGPLGVFRLERKFGRKWRKTGQKEIAWKTTKSRAAPRQQAPRGLGSASEAALINEGRPRPAAAAPHFPLLVRWIIYSPVVGMRLFSVYSFREIEGLSGGFYLVTIRWILKVLWAKEYEMVVNWQGVRKEVGYVTCWKARRTADWVGASMLNPPAEFCDKKCATWKMLDTFSSRLRPPLENI